MGVQGRVVLCLSVWEVRLLALISHESGPIVLVLNTDWKRGKYIVEFKFGTPLGQGANTYTRGRLISNILYLIKVSS